MQLGYKEVNVSKKQHTEYTGDLRPKADWLGVQTQVCGEAQSRRWRERRNFGFSTLVCGTLHCRRRGARRSSDAHTFYVDWYEPRLLYITLGVLMLSSVDAVMTLNLLQHGSVELNPIMGLLIEQNVSLFVYTKLMLTGASLVFLVVHINFRLFRFIKIIHCLIAALVGYLILVAYELVLLSYIILI